MLKLVVDNHKENKQKITCRNSCDLFDEITESCSILKTTNVDSEYEAAKCGFFLTKDTMNIKQASVKEQVNFRFSLIEEEADYLLDDPDVFHQLVGKNVTKETYTYPLKPDFSSLRDDAIWYVSACGTYGCWLVNPHKKILSLPKSIESAEKGWSNKVYKSPIPLHNHKSSITLASKVAWIIDEDGYGQYGLLVNGEIASISSPKPHNWVKK